MTAPSPDGGSTRCRPIGRVFAIGGRTSTRLARSSAWRVSVPHWRRPYGQVRKPHHRCEPRIKVHAATVKETPVSKLRVNAFSVSVDGFGAGPTRAATTRSAVGGETLHEWFLPTRTFQRSYGEDGGTTGVDDEFAARAFENLGAWILGRNMFGPVRGPWPDDKWKGWWGDNPPYHVPVFVLTHHPRPPLEMEGGTTFPFRHRGDRGRARPGAGGRSGQGRADRRRRRHHPAVSAGRAGRRDAPRDLADPARPGEPLFDRHRPCQRSATE